MHRTHSKKKTQVRVISASFVDLAITVTSQYENLKNYFRKFSLVFQLNFPFLKNLLKGTLRKIVFYFYIKILVP